MSVQIERIKMQLADLPLGADIREFLNYLSIEAGLSDNTILGYGRDLVSFARYCNDMDIEKLEQVSATLIQDFQQKLSREQRDENTIKRGLVSIRMFLRFEKMTERIEDDFKPLLETPKVWQKLPITCSKEQVISLLDAPQEEDTYYLRDKAILEALYATGVRASELAGLKVSDVNFVVGYLRCFGKGNKERVVPVGRAAIFSIKEYIEKQRCILANEKSCDYLFLSRTGKKLDRIELWRIVKKYALRAGMPRNISVHTLRHCFATHMLSGGADLRSLQEMLGHVNIATTQIYTHVDQDRLRSIHRKYHPRQ